MPNEQPRRATHIRRALLLGVIALLAYTPGFWWGAPHATAADRTNAWGVDDEPPLGPLAQAHDIIAPKAEMNPNLGYPMLHPFMVLGSFAPYVGYLAVSGGLSSPTVAYPHGFADPVAALKHLTWIAHFLSVLLGVGIVICAYGIARTMWDETTGVVAALGAMLVYPMFYYARNSNVDVPVLFFTATGLWAFATIAIRGLTIRRAVVLGALVGCAVATKEPAFASFVFVPLVLPFMKNPDEKTQYWQSAAFWRTATFASLAALAAYAVGSGLVIDFRRWTAHLDFIRERTQLARSGGVIFTQYYPFTWSGHVALVARILGLLRDALSLPGLALGVIGVFLAARRQSRSALLAYSALFYLAILFFSARVIQLRYVMPVTFVLALYAGYAVVIGWRSVRVVRWATAASAGAAAVILALWAADLTYGMLRDSRYAAGAWLARNARPGDTLEYFGSEHKHPPMPASLASRQAIPFRGSTFRADTGIVAFQSVVEGWRERQPRFVALVPDYTSAPGAPHAMSCPPAIYRALEDGSLGYRRVALFQTPPLFAWARRPALDHPVVNPPIRVYERVVGP